MSSQHSLPSTTIKEAVVALRFLVVTNKWSMEKLR
jgi:hypothetical protein